MYKYIFILSIFFNTLNANDGMMAFFESIKKGERDLVLKSFKQERALHFKLKNRPFFRKNSHKQGNYQHKRRESQEHKLKEQFRGKR